MCVWLDVSSSGFFEWRDRPASATARRREKLKALITDVFGRSDGTYGYRRVHAELDRRRVVCGPELVRDLMRELDLHPCQPRPWRLALTEGQEHHLPDLVGRDFSASEPGEKLVGDITYIPTWEGWLFLATVIDCATKMVIGYALADHYRTPLIDQALRNAAGTLRMPPGAVFHSDRGSNYVSAAYATTISELGLRQSVGRTGICYDCEHGVVAAGRA